MTTEKKPKTKPEPKIDNSMLLNFKMLQAQREIEASKTKVANYQAFEYNYLLPKILEVTNKLNLRIKPTFDMVINEGKPVISCKVDVINLRDMSLKSSVNVGKQAGGIAFWKISD